MSAPATVRLSSVLSALSHALDLTEGHPSGHTARTCLIGMRLTRELGLDVAERSTLFYALLLKDAGCSSNAVLVSRLFGGDDQQVKHQAWLHDWRKLSVRAANFGAALRPTRPWASWARRVWRLGWHGSASVGELYRVRCDRGAEIARAVGFTEATASAVHAMDEHWDGGGYPLGRRGTEIPFAARVVGLAQVAELFWHEGGPSHAFDVVRDRRGRWFDQQIVDLFSTLDGDRAFWESLTSPDVSDQVAAAEPTDALVLADETRLDRIAEAFAWVIDAKSPFTFHHSQRVSSWSVDIGERLGLSPTALTRLRRAALLHDIGKLGVPNRILDHPGRLTESDWELIRRHPRHTYDILMRVPPFAGFAFDASAHHERLNGTGYHRGLGARELTETARILAVADNLDALLADRSYRLGMTPEAVTDILRQNAGTAYCPACAEVGIAALDARGVPQGDDRTTPSGSDRTTPSGFDRLNMPGSVAS